MNGGFPKQQPALCEQISFESWITACETFKLRKKRQRKGAFLVPQGKLALVVFKMYFPCFVDRTPKRSPTI